ncbi:MAG: DUF6058 family natural product biosynthesis protein [Parashewanella sp.]
MELINYLQSNFYTKQELLEISKVTETEFSDFQSIGLMPQCSYELELNLQSNSFFGLHRETQKIEFYAKGYSSWLAIILSLKSPQDIYNLFSERYKSALKTLYKQGHSANSIKLTSKLNEHIQEEWDHFINGIYGLCTKSGLPEDIAAKELAILEINELLDEENISGDFLEKLIQAVNLLDQVSSEFAPHERIKSSRHRFINEVRRNYKLKSLVGS